MVLSVSPLEHNPRKSEVRHSIVSDAKLLRMDGLDSSRVGAAEVKYNSRCPC